LRKDPDTRYPTAQAMQLDLEHFARENKLAMSPIAIAQLMGTLFEKRIDGWLRAQREGRALADYLLETAGPAPDRGPVFMPVGTQQPQDITICEDMDTGVRDARDTKPTMPAMDIAQGVASNTLFPAAKARPRRARRASPLWLAGAAAAVVAAIAITAVEHTTRPAQPDASWFEADARAIATAFDTTARGVRLRADGAGSAPMLRAAIETDAATLADLAKSEKLITPA